MRIAKKNGGLTSVSYPEALDVALCHGWIDGQAADATVISVDATTGVITGKRPGTASVIATYEGAEGSRVQVTVE
jgi:uncharacterized protein YdeI (YjbR/CyaY-like superfamily)